MKIKKIIITVAVTFALFSASALTKLKLSNGILLNFEGCSDGSIRFEATAKKSKSPAKQYELKKSSAQEQFVKTGDTTYSWNQYQIEILENGYKLSVSEKPLYTSTFEEDSKSLKEKRKWSTAREFYGFGEASRSTVLNDQLFTIYNESKYGDHAYVFIPFYVTDEGTSVYYNAGGKDKIYFQAENTNEQYATEYKRIECFVRQNSSISESISKFYKETESTCLLPKWAYGYIQSKYGYESADEVINLINTFEEKNIPLDAVVLDLFWFDQMGDISWTGEGFKDHEKLTSLMKEKNIRLITITEPFFAKKSKNYDELLNAGLLCKDTNGKTAVWNDWWTLKKDNGGSLFNPLGKKAADFMGKKYSDMINSGIDGFWTDLGEPERAPANIKYNKMEEKVFHNYYNYYWSKALYDGVKKSFPDKRLFILSRSAYTGSGKFNVSVWSGDVSASWSSLSNQVAYGVNAGICGLPYWGSDVGGFTNPNTSSPELFVRWHQFGAFTPVYRAHGSEAPREPWIFTEKEEKIVSDLIRTRKTLLPYIYSTACQTLDGIPMMRGMFTEDEKTPLEFKDKQYMFGDAFLICPITEEISYSNTKTYYLPEGTWYNFWDNKKTYSKGQTFTVKAVLENCPVFVKAGSIIPAEKDGKTEIRLYPENGISNSFTLYDDDGETDQYKNGKYGKITFTLEGKKLSAVSSGDDSFIQKEFILNVIPSNKKITITLEQLKNGIEL